LNVAIFATARRAEDWMSGVILPPPPKV